VHELAHTTGRQYWPCHVAVAHNRCCSWTLQSVYNWHNILCFFVLFAIWQRPYKQKFETWDSKVLCKSQDDIRKFHLVMWIWTGLNCVKLGDTAQSVAVTDTMLLLNINSWWVISQKQFFVWTSMS